MNQITKYYVRGGMLLLPLLFLPIVIDSFGMGKTALVGILGLIGVAVWVGEMLWQKKYELKVNKVLGLLTLAVVWAWVGWFRLPEGVRMRSLTDFVGLGALMTVFLWTFLWTQVEDKEETEKQINFLTMAGVLVAIGSVIVFLMPAAKLPIVWPKDNPIFSIGSSWSLTGSLLSEVILLATLALWWGKRLLDKLNSAKQNESEGYLIEAMITAVLSLALMLGVFRIFRTGWVNLDSLSAWVVAVETFKRSPIWGAGIGNFVEAFNLYRPNNYNLTATWANGFLHSSSGILNVWTELGTVGLGLIALAASWLIKMKKNFYMVVVVVLGLIALFLPVNLIGMMLLAWAMVVALNSSKKWGVVLPVGESGFNIAPWVLAAIIVGGIGFSGYWTYRVLAADVVMRQSLVAAAKNDGGRTYNLQIKAIGTNPLMAEYRRVYSQTNLALAKSILANKEVSDEDKQKASTLIQQAVREAKAAIALDGNNPLYWTNLASIYRDLVGVVDGAADWSFQAYQQAVALDPANPVTKLELGGLLYAANRFDEADRVFEQVVVAKSDFANGWYNWAYSAKKMNKLADAVQRMQQAVALVSPASGDFDAATKELTAWKKELDEAIAKANQQQAASTQGSGAPKPETLKTPQPLPTVSKEEKVNVPAEQLEPPKVSPTVTATPSPAVTP